MRNELACAFALLFLVGQHPPGQAAPEYRVALPGYRYEFPRDNFNHPDFQTEWWYYTGNVRSTDGHRFGFELTFFRQGVDRSPGSPSEWDVRDLYIAHLALSDLDGGRFYHTERINRAGPGIAGISQADGRIWNGNWRLQWRANVQELEATNDVFSLQLRLRSAKPLVIHGENGVSQKAEGAGHASHYVSLTRLITSGEIEVGAAKFGVSGLAWMDHEFFTSQLSSDQVGWDWLSIQLEDDTELMLFHLRRKDGSIDTHSSGTYVDANGHSSFLKESDFILEPMAETWTSAASGAVYPVHWRISIPKWGLALDVKTPLRSQELIGKNHLIPAYWEGATEIAGQKQPSSIKGVGYLEMTGYDRPLTLNR